jgi:hypothetical protein
MPEKFHVVGVGRQPAAGKPATTAQALRDHLCSNAGTSKAAGTPPVPCARGRVTDVFAAVSGAGSDEFFAKCSFIHANYDSAADFAALSQHCAAIEDEMCVNCFLTVLSMHRASGPAPAS